MTMDDAVCVRADVDIVDLSPPTNFVVAVDLDLYYFDIIIVVEIMSLGRVRRVVRRRRRSSVVSGDMLIYRARGCCCYLFRVSLCPRPYPRHSRGACI